MLSFNALLGGMVAGESEPRMIEADLFRLDPLVAVEAGHVGDERFDHEDPALGQVRRDVLEAVDLSLLRLQGKKRVQGLHTRASTDPRRGRLRSRRW